MDTVTKTDLSASELMSPITKARLQQLTSATIEKNAENRLNEDSESEKSARRIQNLVQFIKLRPSQNERDEIQSIASDLLKSQAFE